MPSASDGVRRVPPVPRAGVLFATTTPPTAPAELRAALSPATTPPPAPSEPSAPSVPPAPDAASPAPPIVDNCMTRRSTQSGRGIFGATLRMPGGFGIRFEAAARFFSRSFHEIEGTNGGRGGGVNVGGGS